MDYVGFTASGLRLIFKSLFWIGSGEDNIGEQSVANTDTDTHTKHAHHKNEKKNKIKLH